MAKSTLSPAQQAALERQQQIASLPRPLPWQQRLLDIRSANSDAYIFLGGGRYSGKSTAAALLVIEAIVRHGNGAHFRGVVFRSELKGAEKLQQDLDAYLRVIFHQVRFSKMERRWTFAGNGSLSIEQLGDQRAQDKIQGSDLTFALIDDAGLIDPGLVRRITTNLRSNIPGVIPSLVVTANPGDRFSGPWSTLVRQAPAGGPFPFQSSDWAGQKWIVALSNVFDNTSLTTEKRDAYIQRLKADCFGNPVKERQQVFGDWNSTAGGFFDSIRMDVVRLPDGHWTSQDSQTWGSQLRELITPERLWVSGDWGAAAPSWFGLFLQVPCDLVVNGIRIGAHSLIALDEWHSARRAMSGEIEPDRGTLTPTPLAAGYIRQTCQRWGVEFSAIPIRQRILDAACFAQHGSIAGSIGDELRAAGAAFTPGPKGSRADGWMLLAKLWYHANTPAPSCYLTARCEYFWSSVFAVQVSRTNEADLTGPDHALDALRAVANLSLGHRSGGSMRAGMRMY